MSSSRKAEQYREMSKQWNAPPIPTAGQVAPSQNGVADANVPAVLTAQKMLVPQNNVNGAFNGSVLQVDTILPDTLGKMTGLHAQFNISISDTAAGTTYLAPAAYFVTQIDFMVNGAVMESQYPDTLFAESTTFLSDQELYQSAPLLNIDANTGNLVAIPTVAGTVNKTYWLPLCGAFTSMQPFVKGMRGTLSVRMFLAPNIVANANGYTSSGSATVNLTSMYLWADEAQLSPEAEKALLHSHKDGVINYRSIKRSRWTKQQTSLTAGQNQQDVLNSFNTDSAGLYVYLRSSSTDPGWSVTRFPLNSLQLLDSTGSTLTQVLPAQLVESIISPNVTPLASTFVNSQTFTSYLFPFCSSIERVRTAGKVLSGYKLQGTEQLVINPAAGCPTSAQENVVSFEYFLIQVNQGVLKWTQTASNDI